MGIGTIIITNINSEDIPNKMITVRQATILSVDSMTLKPEITADV